MEAGSLGKKNLLFIDDCKDYGGVVCEIMASLSFQCEQVHHPRDAINLLSKPQRPDLVISKFELPGMNAVELYKSLSQSSTFNLNLILLSSMPTIASRKMRQEKVYFPLFDKLDIDELCQYVSSIYK